MVRKAQTLNAEGARRMMGDIPLLSAEQVLLGSRLDTKIICFGLVSVHLMSRQHSSLQNVDIKTCRIWNVR